MQRDSCKISSSALIRSIDKNLEQAYSPHQRFNHVFRDVPETMKKTSFLQDASPPPSKRPRTSTSHYTKQAFHECQDYIATHHNDLILQIYGQMSATTFGRKTISHYYR
ncbi:hypothetical protein O6H91_16G007600 [Diphasiastrum complanatum]|uniref:Uncharacterized protein n=1 Tax=Diphasiastrum complanatum TaxID=34168 RepID=A0ACC2B9M4_DIPCM|nr:hypothetical protein O6H91_16G007600 [Diphasiastrum complanatum]